MYESPIILFKTDPLIQCVKNETDTMVIQGVARAGVHVDKDELIKALEYDRLQYEKGFHDGRMYVPPCQSNADRIRAMSDEELGEWIAHIHCPHYGEDDYPCDSCAECWTEWMKQEVKDEGL